MTTKPTALPEPSDHDYHAYYPDERIDYYTQQQLIDYGRAEYLRAIEQCAALTMHYLIQRLAIDDLDIPNHIRALATKKQQT
jgi:hypothetical protein